MNSLHILFHILACLGALNLTGMAAVRANDETQLRTSQGADSAKKLRTALRLQEITLELMKLPKSELLALIQSNMTLKLNTHHEAQLTSKGVAVPLILIVVALAGLMGFIIFSVVMMRDTADSDKAWSSSPSAQKPLKGLGKNASVLQSSPQGPRLLSSPAPPPDLHDHRYGGRLLGGAAGAQAELPRNSPPQSMVSHSAQSLMLPLPPPSAGGQMASFKVDTNVQQGRLSEPPDTLIGYQGPQPKAPMTSTAMIVRSPEGAVLTPDYKCTPHPEQLTVNFRSLKGANAVVRARIDELGGKPQITVESASGIPLALIDTSCAIYIPTRDAPRRDCRRANIHRVAGSSFQLLGSPCATVLSVTHDTFVVLSAISGSSLNDLPATVHQLKILVAAQGFALRPDVLLTVKCDETGCVQEMRDGRGGVVARQEAGCRETPDRSNIWASQGADITLIVSVILAVWKLT